VAYQRQLFDGATTKSLDTLKSWSGTGDDMPSFLGGSTGSTSNPLRLYATVAYLYRCIEVRSNALLAMPWSIYRGDTELVRHDVDEWPKELAAYQGLEELLWQTEAALCLKAESFWYKRRSRLGPINVRWLDPTTMSPVWGAEAITAFKRQVGNASSELSVDDVVYTRLAGLSETAPRTAPAAAACSAAGVLYNVNEFAAAFFKRGAIKATILTVEGNPPQAERERLKAWWQRFFTGINKAFAAEVVSAAVTPVIVGEGLSELTNTELTATEREEIATALGVPHSLVMSNAANYATAEADRLTFYDMTIVPEANAIARQVNAQLFIPAGLRFEWHPQELPIYQADENERAAAFAAYVNAGLKPSVVAQMLGLNLPEGVTPEQLDPVVPQPQEGTDAFVGVGTKDILGYHIESGVVTRNEARADVGLPPVDDSGDTMLRDLNAKLDVMVKARSAGIAPADAAALVGLDVHIEEQQAQPVPPQLQPGPQNAPQQAPQGTQDMQAQNAQRQDEARKFLRWAKGKRAPDVARFASDVLTDDDKRALLADVEQPDAPALDTPQAWQAYKALLLAHDPGDDTTAEERALLEAEATSQREIARALRKQFKDILPANAEDMDIVALQNYLEQRIGNQAVHDAISAAVRRAVDVGVNIAADQLTALSVGFDYTMIHTAAREWGQQYSAELITNIDNTTRAAVRESVARWYTNGEPLSALTRDLAGTFDERRAKLIAMTETTHSAAQGTLRGYEASGVVKAMVFLTSSDERVCSFCGSLDGQVVALDGKFSDKLPPELQAKLNGKTFATPPVHPGCRCRIGAQLIEVAQ
jgi:HK97 family phage portal protein